MKEELFSGVRKKERKKEKTRLGKPKYKRKMSGGKRNSDNIFCLVEGLCPKGNSKGLID